MAISIVDFNKQAIEKMYEDYASDEEGDKFVFVCDVLCDLTTYDDGIACEIGKDIVEVMNVIQKKQNYNYIRDDSNYSKFIRTINYFIDWLSWGTSVRGAWLQFEDDDVANWFLSEFMIEKKE